MRDGDAETLCVTLRDLVTGLELDLLNGVFADQDIITRAAGCATRLPATLRLKKPPPCS
jgi:alpha-galactosidase